MCHFLTFLFHRVLWDLSVIPTEHTWRAKPIRTYMPLYTIFQFDDRHQFFILYIKFHAQYHSFLYVSFQSWFTWFWWLRIVTFDWSYRIKKKSVQFFVNTVTFYLHYVVFVFINKKNIWLSRCYWVLFCCYLTIRLPFIEVLSSLTKAFLNLLHADRPYTYIAKYIKPVMYVCCSVLPSLCIQKKMSSSLKFKLNAYLLYFNIR